MSQPTALQIATSRLDEATRVTDAYADQYALRLEAQKADPENKDKQALVHAANLQWAAARRHREDVAAMHERLTTEAAKRVAPVLDWTPNHDPRSRSYPVRTPELIPTTAVTIGRPVRGPKSWPTGPVLNQTKAGDGQGCVGYAFTAALAAEPIDLWPAAAPSEFNTLAQRAYTIAKTLDKWPGENYPGTSVLAGAKAMKALNLIDSYRWAFGWEDVVDALTNVGPVVLGLYWKQGMLEPMAGERMTFTGKDVGGHCTTAVAYDPASPVCDGQRAIKIQNSYGPAWGKGGFAWLAVSDLITLLQRQGEACVILPA